jgi:hypothetical protein
MNNNHLTQDEVFEQKRNELVRLLDEADSLVEDLRKSGFSLELPDELREGVNRTRERCYENLFDIVLIAPFQSGKSTTIGVFCDGREISPRGLGGGGIKTSSCIVKVQNLQNKDEEEKAIVNWRTDEDLNRRISEIVGTDDPMDFRSSEGKRRLEQALLREMVCYKNNPSGYEKIDQLRFALIVITYAEHPELIAVKSKQNFGIQEIQEMIRFPKSFTTRWNSCLNSESHIAEEFDVRDVMYAFVDEVICKIHSHTLQRAGMAIIDAPGLFISVYDTQVATMAMQRASAIWYLFDGNRQPSSEDKKALRTIKDAGFAEKVFFGVNYRRNPEEIRREGGIEDEILTTIRQLGFTNNYLLYYNAFLALRAMQGNLLLSKNLDSQTEEQIVLDANLIFTIKQTDNVQTAWLKTTKKVLGTVHPEDEDDGVSLIRSLADNGICESVVNTLMEVSGWNQVTGEIKKYVFENKATSVLVDMGCQPVISILKNIENNLQRQEQEASKVKDIAEQEWKEAQEKVDNFVRQSNKLVKDYIEKRWDEILADDFWKTAMFACTDEVARISSELIDQEMSTLNVLGDGFTQVKNAAADLWNNFASWSNTTILGDAGIILGEASKAETLKEKCQGIIRRSFEEQFGIYSLGWFNRVKDGDNEKYNDQISRKVVRLCEEIQSEWDRSIDENIYLKGLDINIPKFTGDIGSDIRQLNVKQSLENQLQGMADQIGSDFFTKLASFESLLAGGIAAVAFLPLDFVLPGLGITLTLISAAMAAFSSAVTRNDYSRTDELRSKIVSELKNTLRVNEVQIKINLQGKLSVFRLFYESSIHQSLEKIRTELQEIIYESQERFNQAQVRRMEIAETALNIRSNHVEPLSNKMNAFKSSVIDQTWS